MYRHSLEALAADRGRAYVHDMLAEVDPAAAHRLHVNDFRRVVRALEVWKLGNEKISARRFQGGETLRYEAWVIGLTRSEERRVGKECRSRWSPYH